MIFNEIYGHYYRAVQDIIDSAIAGALNKQSIYQIVQSTAFAESITVIPDAIMSGRWPVVDGQFESAFDRVPERPLTNLEKMWLKAILQDPRIRLFAKDISELERGLEDVEPLFEKDFFILFDKYSNGDNYEDPEYIGIFRTVLQAIDDNKKLYIKYRGRKDIRTKIVNPISLEYSNKDDKFRLIGVTDKNENVSLNLAKVRSAKILDEFAEEKSVNFEKRQVVLKLKDERNALERAMLHFSDLEKETVQLDEDRYQITLTYYRGDETEILIRILSFGPMVKVTGPDYFEELIRARLMRQPRVK